VDPPGCRDVDDALAFHPTTGKWAITIADVAAAVPESCEVDASAAIKGTSFYDLEGRVLTPMLPAAISEGSASLLPGSKKRGLTLFLDQDDEGPLLLPTWITVDTTYTYESVLLSPIAVEMGRAFGSDSGSSDPHKWIENAMILYNAFVAAILAKAGSGLLRVQPPSPDLDAAASHPSLAHLLQEAATYETADVEFKSHTSLGLPVYCHASSPLRRYADLVNQRVLHSIRTCAASLVPLSSQKTVAAHLNDRTKAARRFGRDLTFLTHVTPGRVHEVTVIIMLDDKAYVPLWNRVIRIRHFMAPADNVPGKQIRIHVYCDPTQRNWKQRILTAAVTA
jgi:exoribonuclease R